MSDYWHPANRQAPDLRRAILQRLADNLAAMNEPVPSVRTSGKCCWVNFKLDGQQWAAIVCGWPGKGVCSHWHHRYEVLMA